MLSNVGSASGISGNGSMRFRDMAGGSTSQLLPFPGPLASSATSVQASVHWYLCVVLCCTCLLVLLSQPK
eukprot:m.9735 g.9735  ORF g.9735 m.9735 type:complete len:70 (+) comp3586_c0_seq2:2974-3183(+)